MTSSREWVRVRSESELAPGMVVQIRGAWRGWDQAPRDIVRVLSHIGDNPDRARFCMCQKHWRFVEQRGFCAPEAIEYGALYRLETGLSAEDLQREGREIYAPKRQVKGAVSK